MEVSSFFPGKNPPWFLLEITGDYLHLFYSYDIAHKKVEEQDIFLQYDFLEAVERFLNSPIEESLKSDNSIVKALALIDRRVGKRTLNMLKESIKDESEFVRYFYRLRYEAE